jgi:hypothetical protein
MRSFKEYLVETELMEEFPSTGDVFELEIAREEIIVETTVIDVLDDGIVIEADDRLLQILRHVGYLEEDSNMPTARDSISPIHGGNNRDIDEADAPSNQHTGSGSSQDMQMAVDMAKHDARTRALSSIHGPNYQDKEMPPHEFGKVDLQSDGKGGYRATVPLTIKQQQNEAEYHGRNVPLGKPMAGDVKKSKVYVKNAKGNVVKVNFGDPNMTIKKSNPKRRKSFRARHHCENPGPRTSARYWSCRAW